MCSARRGYVGSRTFLTKALNLVENLVAPLQEPYSQEASGGAGCRQLAEWLAVRSFSEWMAQLALALSNLAREQLELFGEIAQL